MQIRILLPASLPVPVWPQPFLQRAPMPYGVALASSLITYAQQHAVFANMLARMIRRHAPKHPQTSEPVMSVGIQPDATSLLAPTDHINALQRAEWLLEAITHERIGGTREARRLFDQWLEHSGSSYSPMHHLVVGVVVVAVPGITMGRLRVRRERAMAVLMRRDLALPNRDPAWLRLISQSCLGVAARAFAVARGKVSDLEPEIAAWFFGERAITFYEADHVELENIQKHLRHMDVLHAAVEQDGNVLALALSPAINPATPEHLWHLHRLEEGAR
ncbi:MAG: hypothetical protein Q8Q39_05875 [bacterium]|nr:hypothetical protein [bacterium]